MIVSERGLGCVRRCHSEFRPGAGVRIGHKRVWRLLQRGSKARLSNCGALWQPSNQEWPPPVPQHDPL